ncbi:MAG: hypothetical protein K0R24_2461 [Gammaproteobacteria bacterium]|jgi:hypothetical protein|nr:hypothetical protein [Gammaproteobacteria bacterium]
MVTREKPQIMKKLIVVQILSILFLTFPIVGGIIAFNSDSKLYQENIEFYRFTFFDLLVFYCLEIASVIFLVLKRHKIFVILQFIYLVLELISIFLGYSTTAHIIIISVFFLLKTVLFVMEQKQRSNNL